MVFGKDFALDICGRSAILKIFFPDFVEEIFFFQNYGTSVNFPDSSPTLLTPFLHRHPTQSVSL